LLGPANILQCFFAQFIRIAFTGLGKRDDSLGDRFFTSSSQSPVRRVMQTISSATPMMCVVSWSKFMPFRNGVMDIMERAPPTLKLIYNIQMFIVYAQPRRTWGGAPFRYLRASFFFHVEPVCTLASCPWRNAASNPIAMGCVWCVVWQTFRKTALHVHDAKQ
jgi:hypothetical protein